MRPRALLVFLKNLSCRFVDLLPFCIPPLRTYRRRPLRCGYVPRACRYTGIHPHVRQPPTSSAPLWLGVICTSRGLPAIALTSPSRTECLICARFTTRTALLPSITSDYFSDGDIQTVFPLLHSLGGCILCAIHESRAWLGES